MAKYTPSDKEIAAKVAESLGQLTREQAATVLVAQHEHDEALAAAEEAKADAEAAAKKAADASAKKAADTAAKQAADSTNKGGDDTKK